MAATSEPTVAELPSPTPDLSFAPIELSGTGDSVVNVDKPPIPAIIEISGNSESKHFAIESLDAAGETLDLLVNTTEVYHGFRPLDFSRDDQTTRLQVSATGDWSATIRPITTARTLEVPGRIDGTGDDVIKLAGSEPDIATISGNQDERHFSVIAYYGSRSPDLLVNTTDVYQGQVVISNGAIILDVSAADNWSIEIAGK